ncbi:hypothetical protein B0H16DRAFT_1520260 [Mycena metata]|uniref:DNA/RNA-binding domain-containing protein n=1 Tax=Mycena metata TaxID=1033252 RepID=A0AAD7JLV5_9AGAR|nr:hypothetical protein B0H16DRAFT_1520260 [Mycena metata]
MTTPEPDATLDVTRSLHTSWRLRRAGPGTVGSTSSSSSYTRSVASSDFTLSSRTDASSVSSGGNDTRTRIPTLKFSKLYRDVCDLELKIQEQDSTDPDVNSVPTPATEHDDDEEAKEREKWRLHIEDHKLFTDLIHDILRQFLAPEISLSHLIKQSKLVVRLWICGFLNLLQSLHRAASSSTLALEHLRDFLDYAYGFYTVLVEDPLLSLFKNGWLEALGELARYKMLVSATFPDRVGSAGLPAQPVSAADPNHERLAPLPSSLINPPTTRVDNSSSASFGLPAVRVLDIEPEPERWRRVAQEWYGAGIAQQPGYGLLHHHLGLLSRGVVGEELRAVYHFLKSLNTRQSFPPSSESVLPIWSVAAQARRARSGASGAELFILLHGVLFLNKNLDDFSPAFPRLLERLERDGAEQREWIIMAVVNICAVFEYGNPTVLPKKLVKRSLTEEDKDKADSGREDSPKPASSTVPKPSRPFLLAMELFSAMLSHVIRHPTRKRSPFARSTLNPYLTAVLMFLATALKHPQARAAMERHLPWDDLAAFFARIPRRVMALEGLAAGSASNERRWAMLTSGCTSPLPEDWCIRGMEWAGHKVVYGQGFWKAGEETREEIEVLDDSEAVESTDGHIEDDEDDGAGGKGSGDDERSKRWVRIVRSAVEIADVVDGFSWVEGTREWRVEGVLARKPES